MRTFVTVHASEVTPRQLNAAATAYLSLERAQAVRRLVLGRLCPVVAVAVGTAASMGRLTAVVLGSALTLCLAAALASGIVEVRCALRVRRALAPSRKVVKSS